MTWDVLIAGNGLAAITLALSLPSHLRIALLCKQRLGDTASRHAQGGIAAVIAPPDTVAEHVQDTLVAGAHHGNREAIQDILQHGKAAIDWLLSQAVPFDTEGKALHLTREGGHGRRRIAHHADHTGASIMASLHKRLAQASHIHVFERHMAVQVRTDAGQAVGLSVLLLDTQEHQEWNARYIVLAGGGLGQMYPHTTTPPECTGDAIAMAAQAGCRLENIEFIQFHPTGLAVNSGDARTFLISEAVRGEGGLLHNQAGQRFMLGQHPLAELAPRDIVARAIAREMQQQPHVWLDISHRPADFVRQHFPSIDAHCMSLGIDITREPMPVCPVQHYTCGGVMTDTAGQTDLPALFCLGEAACTGLHGANRLASNSLLECVVMGRHCAQRIMAHENKERSLYDIRLPETLSSDASHANTPELPPNALRGLNAIAQAATQRATALASTPKPIDKRPFSRAALHELSQQYLGILRSHAGLAQACAQLDAWSAQLPAPQNAREWEDSHLLFCARAVAHAARQRRRNLGAHFNIDLA